MLSPTTATAARDLRAGSASWVSAVLLPEGRVPSARARAQPGSLSQPQVAQGLGHRAHPVSTWLLPAEGAPAMPRLR